jgi:hypothetical protein
MLFLHWPHIKVVTDEYKFIKDNEHFMFIYTYQHYVD